MGAKDRKKRQAGAAASKSKSADNLPAANGSKTDLKPVISERNTTGVLTSRPMAKDIKIESFTLSYHGKELITDTNIELNIGRRYGLIGQNGTGKSTFLTCLAEREVPIPSHIDIFHLNQEAPPLTQSALDYVISMVQETYNKLEQDAEDLLTEYGPDNEQLIDIYDRLEEMDPNTFEVRAAAILHGLGFSKVMMKRNTEDMSGGWRMRVALARALFVKPTLLLLDEPTNHLDLEACVWLEDYLAQYNRCLVIVSHSQDFLNAVCTNIMTLHHTKLKYYGGNYDTYVKTRSEQEQNQMKQYAKQQEEIAHIKQFIASCGTFSNLVKQAKSKQKILDKMEADGLIEKVIPDPLLSFKFPQCGNLPPPVMAFDEVSFAYSGEKKDNLYNSINLGLDVQSRIALVGPNGAGKSTLLKLMVGELSPCTGRIQKHHHLRIGRYHQHSCDQLELDLTPLEYMRKRFSDMNLEIEQWRSKVGQYGITGSAQTSPMSQLSDGLKSRIVFAELSLVNPHLLLLDEPTNHLDMESIDSLAKAINSFDGGLVLVSHDFRLISQVAQEIWVCDKKKVEVWKGDIKSYKQSLRDAQKKK